MKKRMAWLLVFALVLGMLTGCTRGIREKKNATTDEETSASQYGYDSMDDAIQAYLEISIGYDAPTKAELKRAQPKDRWDHDESTFDEQYKDLIEESQPIRDNMKNLFGDSYTLSFDILEKDKLTGDDFDDVCSDLEEVGMDQDLMESLYELSLEVMVDGDDTETIEATGGAYKYDGRWYIAYLDVDN